MIFYTTNNNAFVFSHNKIDQSPKQLYQDWCDKYNVLTPNQSNFQFDVKNADDNCYYLQTKHSVKDDYLKLFTLSSEGAIGIASHFAYPENSSSSISIKNINRMYNVLGGTDFQIISFHPENTDDGFGDVFVQILDDVTLISGELRRSSVTDFAIKIENNKLTLAIKSNINTPVYFNDFESVINLRQQHLIATAKADDSETILIECSSVVGYLSGKVIGKKANLHKDKYLYTNAQQARW